MSSPEDKGVLVVVVLVDDDERQLPPLEVQLDDLGPEEETDLGAALVNQDPGRSEAEGIL